MNIAIVSPLRVDNFLEGYSYFEDFPELFYYFKDVQDLHIFFFTKSIEPTIFSKGFYLHPIHMPFKIGRNLIFSLISIMIGQVSLLISLLSVVKAYNVHIVEANDVLLTGPPALLAAKLSRKPFTLYIAGPMDKTLKHKLAFMGVKEFFIRIALRILKYINKIVIRGADHVFCVTDYLIEDAKRNGARSVSWSPTDINPKKFRPIKVAKENNRFRILYIGRLDPDKGVRHLLDSLSLVRLQVDAELHLIGNGLEREYLKKKAIAMGIAEYVHFRGVIPHSKIPIEINKCDVLILPSFSEGIPRVVVEAMLCRKPTIITPISATSGFFEDGIHTIVVPEGDPYKLAEAIVKVLTDEKLQERLINNAWNIVRRKLLSYGAEHIKVYRKLLFSALKSK